MDNSIIDLCDSDDNNDDVVSKKQSNTAKQSIKEDDDDSSSSSSSSSDDSHLWNAGGFLKGSPQRKDKDNIKAVKRGNYFKEVKAKHGEKSNNNDDRSNKNDGKRMKLKTSPIAAVQREKYGNVNGDGNNDGGKRMKLKTSPIAASAAAARSEFSSPIVSLEIGDDSDIEGGEECTKSEKEHLPTKDSDSTSGIGLEDDASHPHETSNNGRGRDKKRPFSPDKKKSPNNTKSSSLSASPRSSPSKKKNKVTNNKKKDDAAPLCIEIDLSSDSDSDNSSSNDGNGLNEKKNKAGVGEKSKSAVGKMAHSSHHQSKPSSRSAANGMGHNTSDDSEGDSLDFDKDFRIRKKNSPVAKKKAHINPYKSNNIPAKKPYYDSDDGSSSSHSSSGALSLVGKKRPAVAKKKSVQNPYKKHNATKSKPHSTAKTNKSHADDSDGDSSVSLPGEKKRPATKKSNVPQNSHKSSIATKKKRHDSDSDDDSSHSSDSTVSLPEEKKSPTMKDHSSRLKNHGNGKKKSRVSFNTTDDIEFIHNDDDDDDGGAADISFGMYGGFDEDDLPSKSDNASHDKKKEGSDKSMPKAKTKMPSKATNMSLKEDDVEVLDLGSSDDSDDDDGSNSSAELFTPRPFKKKAKTKPAAASYKSEQQSATTTSTEKKKCPNSSSSKMLTPRAYSPATTSPTLGTYTTKKKVPTPAIPAMSSKLVKEIGGKLYPDLRHNFLVVLTSHARRLRHNSYQRASFDSALRSIVVISLHMRPLRSAEAARRIKGVGSNFYDLLKESTTGSKGKNPFAPAAGKYSCVAAATLVALLELEESNSSMASANGQSFPLENVLQKINSLIDPRANASLNQSAEKYLDPSNLDPGFGQIKKLGSTNAVSELGGPFIKERKKKDACASGRIYELLDSGRDVAKMLRSSSQLGPAETGPLRQLPDDTVDEEFGNVTMSMDYREGGGGGRSLHTMCDQLDVRGVPYVVRELKIADYLFFVADKLAPILIERKTAEDVAASLHDGRWEKQKISMRKAQYVLGGGPARRCQICYIIEGDPNKRKVHGGNVGRRTYFQSLEDVEAAIEQLPKAGFSVMKSKGHLDTIGILAKVAQDVSWKAKNGSISHDFTYKQFLSRVKELGDEIGDPPTSREHQNPAPPVVVNAEHIPEAPNEDNNTFSPQSDVPSNVPAKPSNAQPLREENNSKEHSQLKKMSIAQLKQSCKDRDEKIGGKKDELIARLLKPRKPEILIMRARRKEYVPKVPSSNAALVVALLLNHVPGTQGMAKERLMVLAEETGVSKESMSGDGSFYDGWSGMKQLQEGDPALVRREKGHRYSLTTQPPETSGRAVAHALHILAHREGLCTCGNPPPV